MLFLEMELLRYLLITSDLYISKTVKISLLFIQKRHILLQNDLNRDTKFSFPVSCICKRRSEFTMFLTFSNNLLFLHQ